MTGGLYAKYTVSAEADDSARVAKFSVTEDCTSFSTTLEMPLEPGIYTKTIQVKNDSEVAVEYTITLENDTDNIPLLLAVDDQTPTADYCSLAHNMAPGTTDTRTITVKWPGEGAEEYIGKVDLIKVTIIANQID